jgi:hypothetical protein
LVDVAVIWYLYSGNLGVGFIPGSIGFIFVITSVYIVLYYGKAENRSIVEQDASSESVSIEDERLEFEIENERR